MIARTGIPILDDDKKGVLTPHTPGGPQELLAVSTPGFYKLNGRSRKHQAKELDRYIRHTVLPTSRQTGCFKVFPKSATDIRRALDDPAQHRALLPANIEEPGKV
jgi:prophage antirepressor-like protein